MANTGPEEPDIDAAEVEGFKPAFKPAEGEMTSDAVDATPPPVSEEAQIAQQLVAPAPVEMADRRITSVSPASINTPSQPLAPLPSFYTSEAAGQAEPAVESTPPAVIDSLPELSETAVIPEGGKFEKANLGTLEDFVAEKELTPEDEKGLVAYANLAMDRTKNQQAPKGWDRNLDARIREQQKTAFDALTPKAKEVAGEYVPRYESDIKQKEAVTEAA